jgi:hypothetical protein
MNKEEVEKHFNKIHPDANLIQAKPLWEDHWRVNVYKKGSGHFSARSITNSYFCRSQGDELRYEQ